jgi:hypothetical protein
MLHQALKRICAYLINDRSVRWVPDSVSDVRYLLGGEGSEDAARAFGCELRRLVSHQPAFALVPRALGVRQSDYGSLGYAR